MISNDPKPNDDGLNRRRSRTGRCARSVLAGVLPLLAVDTAIAQPIDLTARAPDAHWLGGRALGDHIWVRDYSLRFGRKSRQGSARQANKTMENGERHSILYTHPRWIDQGSIKGIFTGISIPPEAHFRAKVGMIRGARRSDGVTFRVSVVDEAGKFHSIANVSENYDGVVGKIDADLGAFAGQMVSLELRVDAGASSGQDWAGWLDPRIEVSPTSTTLENFGWGAMKVAGKAARGERPLIVVILEYDKRKVNGKTVKAPEIDASHVARFKRYLGTNFPNIGDYYEENSNGRFTFVPATMPGEQNRTGVFYGAMAKVAPHRGSKASLGGQVLSDAISAVEANSKFRFSHFDTDGNGQITPDELTVIVVGNGPSGENENGANVVSVSSKKPKKYRRHRAKYVGNTVFAGFKMGFDVTLHELAHTLGAIDLYDNGKGEFPQGALWGTTLMAMGGSHLDPVNKMLLGWVDPRVVTPEDLRNYSSSFPRTMRLEPLTGDESSQYGHRPLLIVDNPLGGGDIYMVEYRHRAAKNYDPVLLANEKGSCQITGYVCETASDCAGDQPCVMTPSGGVLVWKARLDNNLLPKPRGITNEFQFASSDSPYWDARPIAGSARFQELSFGPAFSRAFINPKVVNPIWNYALLELHR